MEKYYTPEISELCVTFELERQDRDDLWTSYTIEELDLSTPYLSALAEIAADLLEKRVRVKYLDKEDFASIYGEAAIIYDADRLLVDGLANYRGEERVVRAMYNIVSHWLLIYVDTATVYAGECLNKSEYLKLTKRLKLGK